MQRHRHFRANEAELIEQAIGRRTPNFRTPCRGASTDHSTHLYRLFAKSFANWRFPTNSSRRLGEALRYDAVIKVMLSHLNWALKTFIVLQQDDANFI